MGTWKVKTNPPNAVDGTPQFTVEKTEYGRQIVDEDRIFQDYRAARVRAHELNLADGKPLWVVSCLVRKANHDPKSIEAYVITGHKTAIYSRSALMAALMAEVFVGKELGTNSSDIFATNIDIADADAYILVDAVASDPFADCIWPV